MKQCPICKNTYTDDSLQFCLSDGTPLISIMKDAPPTVQMSFDRQEPLRVNIPADSVPTIFVPSSANQNQTFAQNQPKKSNAGLIVAGIFGVLLFLIGGFLAAYFMIPRSTGNNNSSVAINAAPTATALPKTSPNDETAKLKEEMANLKKQLENQKNQKSNQAVLPDQPSSDDGRTAYADSPNDGFLALRSEPSSEAGMRLAKIPHGAALTVFNCPHPANVGKISGRWCRVLYNGQAGWAFDGFMKF